jgi:ubiquinone/menaquinone biosynthesis C-methylase UbiE
MADTATTISADYRLGAGIWFLCRSLPATFDAIALQYGDLMDVTKDANIRVKSTYVLKALGRRVIWGTSDLLRSSEGENLVPPRRLSFVGRGDFKRTGHEFVGYFKNLGSLTPDSDVLDMGCGIGRMAIPLMTYLQGGSYKGFDVGKEMITWCQRNISTQHPNFEFTWAPIYNRKYNPFGTIAANDFRFPYADSSFDFAFATSLFTHLVKDEIRHYLAETTRVLRPGGTCLLTFFLLTPDAEREMASGQASFVFRHEIEGARTVDPKQPEEAIAYQVNDLRTMLREADLTICEPIHYGLWANATNGVAGQDIVLASRDPLSHERVSQASRGSTLRR